MARDAGDEKSPDPGTFADGSIPREPPAAPMEGWFEWTSNRPAISFVRHSRLR